VFSVRFQTPFSGQPFGVYRRLRQANPSPFMFYMRFEEETVLGSSPEMMVNCQAGRLEVRPIAGTRPRGATETQDMVFERELLADPKERAEHVMLVDLGRNDLGRIAKSGSVEVAKFMQVERFSHVMHAIDVLTATFPAGTVSGAPKFGPWRPSPGWSSRSADLTRARWAGWDWAKARCTWARASPSAACGSATACATGRPEPGWSTIPTRKGMAGMQQQGSRH
jgi:Anthranilate/para-aminobenzoate synthases component I